MKSILKLISLTFCILLSSSCKTEAQEGELENNTRDYRYTDYSASETNTYLQVDDSVFYFDRIEGGYFFSKSANKNAFFFFLSNSDTLNFNNINCYTTYVNILTERMEPEVFFQKGVRIINFIRIRYGHTVDGIRIEPKYYDTQSILIWDTVSYENRKFYGKGSIEIMDSLYIKNPYYPYYGIDIHCYPPQKIEFEFNKYNYE
jgi:hypothetical protein